MFRSILVWFGFGWRDSRDDGLFVEKKNRFSGETRIVVPARRIRRCYPWSEPNFK